MLIIRLYSFSKIVSEDMEFYGYSFPRGTTVMSNLIYMHYDPKVCLLTILTIFNRKKSIADFLKINL